MKRLGRLWPVSIWESCRPTPLRLRRVNCGLCKRWKLWAGRDLYWRSDVYEWTTTVRAAERKPMGTTYPVVVERVRRLGLHLAEQAWRREN